jgi:hypothetical protein
LYQGGCEARGIAELQPLEPRSLFSVSLNAAGYTVITPGGDDRVIYVSNSTGNDGNDGSSPAKAVRSLDRGYDLIRDNHGDQMLLKRGDTWHGALPHWNKSGDTSNNPMLLGAYGTGDRPLIATGGDPAFAAVGARIDHLAIQGIRFSATARDPDSPDFNGGATHNVSIGVQFFAAGNDVLLEDCWVSDYGTNVTLQDARGAQSNVRLRRNVIVDAYSDGSAHSEGLYAEGVHGLLLEENVFDHNGWNTKVSGAGATIFNHNAYLNSSTRDVVVRGNVFANASSHGLQARSGGDIEDNLFIANPIGMSYGLVRGDGSPADGGVSGIVNGNVFLGLRDIAGQTRGTGIEIANIKADGPTILSNNIFSNVSGNGVAWQAGGFAAISLAVGSGVNDASLAVGVNDLTIQGNIVYRWQQGLSMQSDMRPGADGTDGYHRLVVKQNEFSRILDNPVITHPAEFNGNQERWSGNLYDGGSDESKMLRVAGRSLTVSDWAESAAGDRTAALKYAAPDRSLASYMGGDGGAFVATARTMSAATSSSAPAAAAISYFRDGFANTASSTPRNWNAPTPPIATATLPASVRSDESSLSFTVTYKDDTELDLTTLGSSDVMLVGPGGRHSAATLVTLVPLDAKTATATYQVASPSAVWRKKDRGGYKVVMGEAEVKDNEGFSVEAGTIGSGNVDVVVVPAPPTVKKVKFTRGKRDLPDTLSITLSADLVGPPPVGDLHLNAISVDATGATISTPVDLSAAQVAYDATKHRLTWTLLQLASGQYQVELSAAHIATAVDGKLLDGNKDGLGGDDFAYAKLIRVKR